MGQRCLICVGLDLTETGLRGKFFRFYNFWCSYWINHIAATGKSAGCLLCLFRLNEMGAELHSVPKSCRWDEKSGVWESRRCPNVADRETKESSRFGD